MPIETLAPIPGLALVGLTGAKGSGKSTVAEILRRAYGFKVMAFADPLRMVCSTAFGLDSTHYDDRDIKEKPLDRWPYESPRQILQKVGTELFRHHYPGVWVNQMIQRIQRYSADRGFSPRGYGGDRYEPPLFDQKPLSRFPVRVVVSDTRFWDEAGVIRKLGGSIVRIDRDGCGGDDAHASEKAYKEITPDFVIVNNHTPDALTRQAAIMAGKLFFIDSQEV
jgi:hypothetical protein